MSNNSVRSSSPAIVIQSLLVAFYADIKCVNLGLVYGGFTDEGTMGALYLVVIFLSIAFSFFGKNNLSRRITVPFILLLLWLIGFYFITRYFIGEPHTSLPLFMVFVVFSLLIPNLLLVDARLLIKGIMFFPFFVLFRLDQVFSSISDWSDVISMDTSYAFLVPIIATVGYLFLFFKDERGWKKVLTVVLAVINFVFFTQILQYGSRGPLLCIFSCIVFLLVVKPSPKKGVVFKRGFFSFSIIGLLLLGFMFSPIIELTGQYFKAKGIQIHALEKVIRLEQEGDLTNGRNVINSITLDGIRESPLWGHGLDRFDANTGLLYPHNFLLQLLYDGGILLFIILLVPVIVKLIRLLKSCNKSEYSVFTVLFFSSVPGAFFSGDLWGLARLWLFFGFILSKSFTVDSSMRLT